ncbi:hypothetical protein IQ264_12025 [Phormidium sp. LEGE 05292]|uniref:hypothetical protein n=1 Tax=[Phormidium] sp. LEGE 05292 TaxID=767427 RepID=UPI0018810409|nr:hypothetical protein [Phormidium sp. LEGE 05292]MBE9226152.1 hypothetical protein [Phormidium sp. LEGE 05292]
MKKPLSLLLLLLLFYPQVAKAQENPFMPSDQSSQNTDFWQPAQQLVQEQIYLVSQLEKAIASADPNFIRGVRSQLFLHTSAVDRFLRNYYAYPVNLCRIVSLGNSTNLPPFVNLTSEQLQLYCYLYSSTSTLETLKPTIDGRLVRLGDVQPISPPAISPLPSPEPPLIGREAKQPIEGYLPPVLPAIAISIEATQPLLNTRRLLSQATLLFPPSTKFNFPNQLTEDPYNISEAINQLYHPFLTLPNTGIARILPAEFYRQDAKELRSRLLASRLERFPYPPLAESGVFLPRLEIQLDNDRFQIVQRELNYGFMEDLGDVAIENLDPTLLNVAEPTREFFLKYQPPDKLEALQIDRRLFITGKIEDLCCIKLFAQSPAVLNHTYLVRSVQFQLPEAVLNNERIPKGQRRNLELLLTTPSSDLLIAFRPVSLNSDGSYTVLWRIINRFPDPQITDLDKYVILE